MFLWRKPYIATFSIWRNSRLLSLCTHCTVRTYTVKNRVRTVRIYRAHTPPRAKHTPHTCDGAQSHIMSKSTLPAHPVFSQPSGASQAKARGLFTDITAVLNSHDHMNRWGQPGTYKFELKRVLKSSYGPLIYTGHFIRNTYTCLFVQISHQPIIRWQQHIV